jgi:hypothetical protein
MSKRLGLLLIRGSGESGFQRQKRFMERLEKDLTSRDIDSHLIQHEYVDWYEPLQESQESILDRMEEKGICLKSRTTRNLIITNIGDLINYGGKPNFPSSTYQETHKLVHKSVVRLKNELIDKAPLVILASSMGTEIINNYIWDRQHAVGPDPLGNSAFERFETLVGLFTLGSNLPIFASSHNIDDLVPITFPSPRLAPEWVPKAVWENYYDKNDSMGYPIKAINDHYSNANVLDIQINTGGILTSWNLLSHFGYWNSKKLVNRIANYIQEII